MQRMAELLRDQGGFRRWAVVPLALTAICWLVLPAASGTEVAGRGARLGVHVAEKPPGAVHRGGVVKESEEDLVEGLRLRSVEGRIFIVPYRTVRDNPAFRRFRQGQHGFSRSMRSINDSIRRMRTNIDRIRTYRRLFR